MKLTKELEAEGKELPFAELLAAVALVHNTMTMVEIQDFLRQLPDECETNFARALVNWNEEAELPYMGALGTFFAAVRAWKEENEDHQENH